MRISDLDVALSDVRRVPHFTADEIVEFRRWIDRSTETDLPRHEQRLKSALRLRCISATTASDLARAIAARRSALAASNPNPPTMKIAPPPMSPAELAEWTAKITEATAAELAALKQMTVRLAAAAALNETGSRYVQLFLPTVEEFLRFDDATDSVVVVDEDAAVRRGVTPTMLAEEIRKIYPTL